MRHRRRPVALVLRALGLGDLLVAVPALRGIRRALPRHRIVLATPAPLAPLARLSGAVDDVVDATGLERLRWRRPPAVAVNLHGSGPQSHRLLLATGPRRLVAYASLPAGVAGPVWEEHEHEAQRWCRLVAEELGVRCERSDLDLARPEVDPPVRGTVVLHPGAAFPSRRWPVDRWAGVARWLAARGVPVAVTGSAAERGLGEAVAASAGLPAGAVLSGRTSPKELAAVVAHARLVLCGDTGVGHLATAYRRPSVLLFGPVSPERWGPPPRPEHIVLWHGTGDGDPWGDEVDPGLLRITVPEVVESAVHHLRTYPAGEKI